VANKEAVNILFEKYLSGTITPDEFKIFLSQAEHLSEEDELSQRIQKELEKAADSIDMPLIDEIVDHVEHRLFDEVYLQKSSSTASLLRRERSKQWSWLRAAAAGLIAFGFCLYLWHQNQENTAKPVDMYAIGPGGNRATLTFGDGQVVNLE